VSVLTLINHLSVQIRSNRQFQISSVSLTGFLYSFLYAIADYFEVKYLVRDLCSPINSCFMTKFINRKLNKSIIYLFSAIVSLNLNKQHIRKHPFQQAISNLLSFVSDIYGVIPLEEFSIAFYVKYILFELWYMFHLTFNISDTHISWKGYLIGNWITILLDKK
jgi:uncharacterized membrane protein